MTKKLDAALAAAKKAEAKAMRLKTHEALLGCTRDATRLISDRKADKRDCAAARDVLESAVELARMLAEDAQTKEEG